MSKLSAETREREDGTQESGALCLISYSLLGAHAQVRCSGKGAAREPAALAPFMGRRQVQKQRRGRAIQNKFRPSLHCSVKSKRRDSEAEGPPLRPWQDGYISDAGIVSSTYSQPERLVAPRSAKTSPWPCLSHRAPVEHPEGRVSTRHYRC